MQVSGTHLVRAGSLKVRSALCGRSGRRSRRRRGAVVERPACRNRMRLGGGLGRLVRASRPGITGASRPGHREQVGCHEHHAGNGTGSLVSEVLQVVGTAAPKLIKTFLRQALCLTVSDSS